MKNDTTILIVNWNAGDCLIDCLKSISKQYQVIIVDNNSKDESIKKVRLNFPDIDILESSHNLGFSAANNLGLSKIHTKYVLFLNPDTLVIDGAIEKMTTFLELNTQYDAVGPQIIERDGGISPLSGRRHFNLWSGFCEAFFLNRIFSRSRFFNRQFIPEWDRLTSRDVECLTGCAALMRTDAVRKVGGFDESVPLYLDDMDLCRKLTEKGSKIRCLVDAKIKHLHQVSSNKAPLPWITYVTYQAFYTYLMKYNNRLVAAFYRVFLLLSSFFRIIAFYFLKRFNNSYVMNYNKGWLLLNYSLYYCGSNRLNVCPEEMVEHP